MMTAVKIAKQCQKMYVEATPQQRADFATGCYNMEWFLCEAHRINLVSLKPDSAARLSYFYDHLARKCDLGRYLA